MCKLQRIGARRARVYTGETASSIRCLVTVFGFRLLFTLERTPRLYSGDFTARLWRLLALQYYTNFSTSEEAGGSLRRRLRAFTNHVLTFFTDSPVISASFFCVGLRHKHGETHPCAHAGRTVRTFQKQNEKHTCCTTLG